ncbi:cytochrome c biogenesis CcdA family protein [Pseudomonas sp. 2FE]|uniref:cytochrome c biogenesis CcdA family protein n=1 Tax=Pseudomonas sp. 2FE TaxID=2502190 RepID=UPI0010F60449|nr:cytochrome c biogenesis protein CcdA [Pseudomonas sp. 2FE]
MELEALRQAMAQIGPAALGMAFLAGFFFSLNPVAVGAIPVALAYVTMARTRAQAFWHGLLFILGMLLTHLALGIVAGSGGEWIYAVLGREWGLFLGPLLILMGLFWSGWLRLPLPSLPLRAKRVSGGFGAFLLGMPFSVAVCPTCTPALVVVLGVAASVGSALWGACLLLAFAAGRAIPLALGAWSMAWLENTTKLAPLRKPFELLGALLLILAGLYLLNAYFVVVPWLAV